MRWICNECGWQTADPAEDRKGRLSCRWCGGEVEEMLPCPTCDMGWRMIGDRVCSTCHRRNEGEIRMFVRRFCAETLEDMEDILDGEKLVNFQ